MSEKDIVVTILRCSRCNDRIPVVATMQRTRCGECGAAYKRSGDKWICDLDNWTTKENYRHAKD